jgi:hypothetical protein
MFAFYLLPFFGCLEHMNFGQGIRHADALSDAVEVPPEEVVGKDL